MCETKIPVQNHVCSWNFIQFSHDFILFGNYSFQSIHGGSSSGSANGRKARAIAFAHRTRCRCASPARFHRPRCQASSANRPSIPPPWCRARGRPPEEFNFSGFELDLSFMFHLEVVCDCLAGFAAGQQQDAKVREQNTNR